MLSKILNVLCFTKLFVEFERLLSSSQWISSFGQNNQTMFLWTIDKVKGQKSNSV